jgi:hypothetical protein
LRIAQEISVAHYSYFLPPEETRHRAAPLALRG